MYVCLEVDRVGLILCLVLMSLYPIKLKGYVGYVIESMICFLGFILLVVSSLNFVFFIILVCWYMGEVVRPSLVYFLS